MFLLQIPQKGVYLPGFVDGHFSPFYSKLIYRKKRIIHYFKEYCSRGIITFSKVNNTSASVFWFDVDEPLKTFEMPGMFGLGVFFSLFFFVRFGVFLPFLDTWKHSSSSRDPSAESFWEHFLFFSMGATRLLKLLFPEPLLLFCRNLASIFILLGSLPFALFSV